MIKMNYTIRQLQVYQAVGTHLSFTKAAEHLHLSQPGVSIQFKAFSEQFDFPLIEYRGKKMIMTELGREVYQRVQQILDQTAALNAMNKSVKGKLYGTLNISIVSTAKYIMPYLLNDFLAEHPEVDLIMDVTNKSRVIESLEENRVDFSLVSTLPDKLKVKNLELIPNELHLVGSPKLAEAIEMDKKEVTYLFREPGSATRLAMEHFLRTIEVVPYKKVELTSNEAVKQSVMAGLGVSVMPLIGMNNELSEGRLKIIPHNNLPIVTQWNLIWREQKNLSPVAAAYLEFLDRNKTRIINAFNT